MVLAVAAITAAEPSGQRVRLLAIGNQCGVLLTPVGTVVEGEGVTLIRQQPEGGREEIAITYQGFDHFRNRAGE